MTTQRLTLAGWVAITNAVLTIPFSVLGIFIGWQQGRGMKTATVLLTITGLLTIIMLVLFIFIFSSLKDLLNTRFNFRDTDIFISVIIWVNVSSGVISVIGILFTALETVAGVIATVLIVPYGIVSIVFAIKLLQLPDTLHGMLKPFAYTSMAAGLCFASIVLIPVGLLTSAITDIILGIIFLRAAESSTKATT